MKKYLPLFGIAATTVVLSACQSTPTPQNTVDGYLKAMQSGNSEVLRELRCLKEDSPPIESLTGVKSWEVIGVEQKADEQDPDSQYSLVSVKIESDSAVGGSVNRTWKFSVWKSDELFAYQQRFANKAQELINRSRALVAQSSALRGEQPPAMPSSSAISAPDRSTITNKLYCITSAKPL